MKCAYALLIVIFNCIVQNTFSQQQNIQNSDSTENNLTQLRIWRYKSGDSSSWSLPEYEDGHWSTMDISHPAKTLVSKFSNITWLRYKVPPALVNEDSVFALIIEQFGASEIYINGVLVKTFGKIISPTQYKIFNPHKKPIPIILRKRQANTIAIRFATDIPKSGWILSRIPLSPDTVSFIKVKIQTIDAAITSREEFLKGKAGQMAPIVITGLFGVLFLLLYLYYPKEKLHLFFSLFNFFLLLISLLENFVDSGQYSLSTTAYLDVSMRFISRLIGMSILIFMFYALDKTRSILWWFVAFVLLIDFPLSVILPIDYLLVSAIIRSFMIPISIWLAYYAFKSRRREDILIGVIAIMVISVNFSFVVNEIWGINTGDYALKFAPAILFVTSVFYVAIRYSRTNRSLEKQLVEVQKLSADNLRQEQEKQAILSSQKDLLESQVLERTAELNEQKKELQITLDDLKSTQAQLIQSEKMASLGELTAGIAHEIQNPLNFVNNFSDVSNELLEEMKTELDKGNVEDAKTIADDIKQNLEKILHHGKRADGIVKGMLQHTRTSSGQKEPTDINVLCDEYSRLAYHGLRAKDKTFNAEVKTHFDDTIGKIDIVPQDIGRVVLNLINNAFYAVSEKAKQNISGYEPAVTVSTRKSNNKIEITVKDNGKGIPDSIKEKIFQPFFTTKPTGQGTGLGLSLSYDIIKVHGGEIIVDSKENESCLFTVILNA